MSDETKWIKDMLQMARTSFEASAKGMDLSEEQAQKAVESAIDNASAVQEETKKAVKDWFVTVKSARETYFSSVEEGLSNLEEQFSNKK